VKVKDLNHVCFTVSDLERSVGFWSLVLGRPPERTMEYDSPTDAAVTGYPGVRMSAAYFELPRGVLLELFQYHEPAGVEAASHETYVVGAAHVGLVLEDLDEACRRLEGSGAVVHSGGPVRLQGGEHSGGRSMYVRDPDGITIEMLEFPE
jgi:catechol 2,3-dioxygenase-like lactoylglutathione lyase family enzyme